MRSARSSSLVSIMSTAQRDKPAHSADVQMHLFVNGHSLRIGHLGPDYVILDAPIDHPPSEAEVSLVVDGRESRWAVRLSQGLSSSKARAPISATTL
jgi:hypothetical protein